METNATAALAQTTAIKQSADEQWITRIDEGVKDLGTKVDALAEGQKAILATLKALTDQTHALVWTRIVWPGLATLATLTLGGFSGALVWHLLAR